MKTYLINLPKSLNLISEKLDAKSILCNKPWLVFNDEGYKQVLIFQKDGSLIVSNNGEVVNSKWSYITANKSLLITIAEKTYMFHPAFLDKVIFALKQDGKEEYLFMIDENNILLFQPKSLEELDKYFIEKIEAEEAKEKFHRDEEMVQEQKKKERIDLVAQIKIEYGDEIKMIDKKQHICRCSAFIILLISMLTFLFIRTNVGITMGVILVLSGTSLGLYGEMVYDTYDFIEKKLQEIQCQKKQHAK